MVWKREGGVKFSHIKQNNNDFIQVPQILNLNLKIKYFISFIVPFFHKATNGLILNCERLWNCKITVTSQLMWKRQESEYKQKPNVVLQQIIAGRQL